MTREKPAAVFHLRFVQPQLRATHPYPTLDAAKEAAWDMRRDGTGRPVEILDHRLAVVMDRAALRAWLDLQDRDWPEPEGQERLDLD